jgi:uncharacterized protein YndB with AHSA1/START domain
MGSVQVESSRLIDAPPETVFGVLADYHVGHPAILPKPYFTGLKILEGGQGAGTVLHVDMNIFGVERSYRQQISEPEPGRVLKEDSVELQRNLPSVTTFTVEPRDGGKRSLVTIASEFETAPGFQGMMEKLMNPLVTRQIYAKELAQLDAYVQE